MDDSTGSGAGRDLEGPGPPAPDTSASRARWLGVAVGAAVLLAGVWLAGRFPYSGEHYGIWSLAPPIVAVVLAFALRDVVAALFVGIALGGVISGRLNIVQEFLIPSVGSPEFGLILVVYLWCLGGLIGLWTRTGGALRFAEWAGGKIVTGPRSAMVFAWLMGLVFHQGGTISTVLTGTTVRPIADRNRIAHEEFSFIVDTTGSPVATLIPFNVWPIYVAGLVAGTVPVLATQELAIAFFFRALPFNFFAILVILFTLLFSLERLPFLPGRRMMEARRRARETGRLDDERAEPLSSAELTVVRPPAGYSPGLVDFFAPIGTLLGVAIGPYLWTFFVLGRRGDPSLPIAEAFVLSVLVAMGVALAKGMRLRDVMDGFVSGCKGVTIGAIVLALAVTLKSVADAVGTASYVVAELGEVVSPVALPALLLLVAMFIAFSTGTSWGTYAVLFPVAMPLAWSISPDPGYLALSFAAVTGGGAFGDQCSPISDTTILSSLATGCDLMDHVTTQLPIAIWAAVLGAVLYTVITALLL
jgi:Na+/H+ antiporter NhaC